MNINLITDILDFPNGTAGTMRVKMIGKSLMRSGCAFAVYTNALINNKFNKFPEGEFDGIVFKYLHGTTQLKKSKLIKLFLYIKGIYYLRKILSTKNNRTDIIYIYSHGSIFNLITIILCKIYKLKIVQEINEWDSREKNFFLKTCIEEGPMIKYADAAIIISNNIKNEVEKLNAELKTFILPVLEDPLKFETDIRPIEESYCFWMGQVDGYLDDILFMIKSCGLAFKGGKNFSLYISGSYSKQSLYKINEAAEKFGYPIAKIRLLGYIDEKELMHYTMLATFFIVPLWNNQKSFFRFPTKLSTFMFCGKPIITCKIGEVGRLLSDGINALFYNPGDEKDLCCKIIQLLEDDKLYTTLCDNSKRYANRKFSYLKYSKELHGFFYDIIK